MKAIKTFVLLLLTLGVSNYLFAETQIDGDAITNSSFTFTGLVAISTLTSNNVTASTVIATRAQFSDGSAASPSLTFTNDSDTGLWRKTTNELALGANANTILVVSTTSLLTNSRVFNPDGTDASPSITFTNDTDTGISRGGSNNLHIDVGGNEAVEIHATDGMRIKGMNVFPYTDNAYTIGKSGQRWSAVWAANGTIQTSASTQKQDIQEVMTSQEGFKLVSINAGVLKPNNQPVKDSKIQIPRALLYKWKKQKGKPEYKDILGFMGDDLPMEAHAILPDGTRDPENFYTSSVIGLLCAKVREQDELIQKLTARLDILEGKGK